MSTKSSVMSTVSMMTIIMMITTTTKVSEGMADTSGVTVRIVMRLMMLCWIVHRIGNEYRVG